MKIQSSRINTFNTSKIQDSKSVSEKLNKTSSNKEALINPVKENRTILGVAGAAILASGLAIYSIPSKNSVDNTENTVENRDTKILTHLIGQTDTTNATNNTPPDSVTHSSNLIVCGFLVLSALAIAFLAKKSFCCQKVCIRKPASKEQNKELPKVQGAETMKGEALVEEERLKNEALVEEERVENEALTKEVTRICVPMTKNNFKMVTAEIAQANVLGDTPVKRQNALFKFQDTLKVSEVQNAFFKFLGAVNASEEKNAIIKFLAEENTSESQNALIKFLTEQNTSKIQNALFELLDAVITSESQNGLKQFLFDHYRRESLITISNTVFTAIKDKVITEEQAKDILVDCFFQDVINPIQNEVPTNKELAFIVASCLVKMQNLGHLARARSENNNNDNDPITSEGTERATEVPHTLQHSSAQTQLKTEATNSSESQDQSNSAGNKNVLNYDSNNSIEREDEGEGTSDVDADPETLTNKDYFEGRSQDDRSLTWSASHEAFGTTNGY